MTGDQRPSDLTPFSSACAMLHALRERQRDALVGYLVARLGDEGVRSAADLFGHLGRVKLLQPLVHLGRQRGQFRRDLYYRLRVVVVNVPALRERRTDIPLLARHFLEVYGDRFGRPGLLLSREALAALMSHAFPGNVRELENAIQAAVALAPGDTITEHDLRLEVPCCGQGAAGLGRGAHPPDAFSHAARFHCGTD